MPDDGHRYFFGGWPKMPWKNNLEEPMVIIAEDFDDTLDDDEFPLEDEPLSWEVLEEKELDEIYKADDED